MADFVIDVWVVPNSSRSQVDGRHGDALKLRVTAPPEQGRANAEVCDLLRNHFAAKTVEVIAGTGSRRKRVRVSGAQNPQHRE